MVTTTSGEVGTPPPDAAREIMHGLFKDLGKQAMALESILRIVCGKVDRMETWITNISFGMSELDLKLRNIAHNIEGTGAADDDNPGNQPWAVPPPDDDVELARAHATVSKKLGPNKKQVRVTDMAASIIDKLAADYKGDKLEKIDKPDKPEKPAKKKKVQSTPSMDAFRKPAKKKKSPRPVAPPKDDGNEALMAPAAVPLQTASVHPPAADTGRSSNGASSSVESTPRGAAVDEINGADSPSSGQDVPTTVEVASPSASTAAVLHEPVQEIQDANPDESSVVMGSTQEELPLSTRSDHDGEPDPAFVNAAVEHTESVHPQPLNDTQEMKPESPSLAPPDQSAAVTSLLSADDHSNTNEQEQSASCATVSKDPIRRGSTGTSTPKLEQATLEIRPSLIVDKSADIGQVEQQQAQKNDEDTERHSLESAAAPTQQGMQEEADKSSEEDSSASEVDVQNGDTFNQVNDQSDASESQSSDDDNASESSSSDSVASSGDGEDSDKLADMKTPTSEGRRATEVGSKISRTMTALKKLKKFNVLTPEEEEELKSRAHDKWFKLKGHVKEKQKKEVASILLKRKKNVFTVSSRIEMLEEKSKELFASMKHIGNELKLKTDQSAQDLFRRQIADVQRGLQAVDARLGKLGSPAMEKVSELEKELEALRIGISNELVSLHEIVNSNHSQVEALISEEHNRLGAIEDALPQQLAALAQEFEQKIMSLPDFKADIEAVRRGLRRKADLKLLREFVMSNHCFHPTPYLTCPCLVYGWFVKKTRG